LTGAGDPRGTIAVALSHGFDLLAREPAMAAEQASEILKVAKGDPRAHFLMGAAKRRLGEAPAAIGHLAIALKAMAPSAELLLELALAEAARGEGKRAMALAARAMQTDGGVANGWRAVADELTRAGDDDLAGRAYVNHVTASAKDPALLDAAVALNDGRIAVAERQLKSYLTKHPTDVAAIRMLAELAARLGRHIDAEALLTRALELAPDFRAARHNLAIVQLRQGKTEEPIAAAEALLKSQPNDPGYRTLYCAALVRHGDYDRAIPEYARLLQAFPNHPKNWMSYGHALKTVGRAPDAIGAYQKSIALKPSLGEAWWSLANLKTFRFSDDDIAVMERENAREDISDEDRVHLSFALGKAFEDRRDYARSFAHYDRANRLRQTQIGYDEDEMAGRMEEIGRFFTCEIFTTRKSEGHPAPDPIFIVGMPRAGSTLIEQILSSHSLIEGTTELPDIINIARELGRLRKTETSAYPAILADLPPEDLSRFGALYIERTRPQRKTGKPYFIDKMPNNFMHAGLIRLILPNAKIIDARRHPMACCFSNFKQHFAKGQGFSYGQERIARYYRDYVALMARWDATMPGAVHRVIHERLVEDLETEVRAMLAFIGVAFEEACLKFYETDRAIRTPSSEQVRRPIFTEGIDQWRNYEEWLGPMKQALGDVLTAYPAAPIPASRVTHPS
jgi:tetratricopeptide (TPR) repeat protein